MTIRPAIAPSPGLADLGKVSVETKSQKSANSEFETGQQRNPMF